MADLSQIQTFLEVVRSGSFADASRRLSVPRSTVSARVRALEERLTVRLLHRTTRRVVLTDEGRRYRERCQEAIEKLIEAEAELSRPDDVSGKIRVTVPVDMSKHHLARTLTAFTDRHPSVRIEVVVTDELVDLVASNTDLALRGGIPGASGLVARKLGEGQLSLYASPRYAAERLAAATLSNLSGHVFFDPTNRGKGIVEANAESGRFETRSLGLAKALAVQSRGIALLPESICEDELQAGRLTQLAFDRPLPVLALYIVMPTRQHVPARVRTLVDFLISAEKPSSLA